MLPIDIINKILSYKTELDNYTIRDIKRNKK